MLWGGKARLFLQVKENDEKIAIIHVACPQAFFFFIVFVVGWLFVCFSFLLLLFRQFDSIIEQLIERSAREKNTKPLALAVAPPLLFSYARLTMSKIEGNKQANIHAVFAIFLTSFLPLPSQETYSSLLWLYFLSWRLYGARLLYFLTLPSFFFPKFSTLVQAILVFFTLNAGAADHVRYAC